MSSSPYNIFAHKDPQGPPEAKHLLESQFFAVPPRGTVAYLIILPRWEPAKSKGASILRCSTSSSWPAVDHNPVSSQ